MTEVYRGEASQTDRRTREILVPKLRQGLSAIPIPEFPAADSRVGHELPTSKQALDHLNTFLQELTKQGADLIQIVEVSTLGTARPGGMSRPGSRLTEVMKIAIVNRK